MISSHPERIPSTGTGRVIDAADIAALQVAPLFQQMPELQLCALAAAAQRRSYGRGEIIAEPGEGQQVAIVVRGEVQMTLVSREGQELTLWRRESGGIFHFGALVGAAPCQAVAQALRDQTVLYSLSCARFVALVCTDARTFTALAEAVRKETESDVRLIHELAFSSVQRRLAHVLAGLGEQADPPVIRRTRTELASLLGTRAEEVSKALRSLMDQGLVEYVSHGRSIRLIDVEQLRQY